MPSTGRIVMARMPPTGMRMTVTRMMMGKGLVRGTQQVLVITVPSFFP